MKIFLLLCIFQLLNTIAEGQNRFKGGKDTNSASPAAISVELPPVAETRIGSIRPSSNTNNYGRNPDYSRDRYERYEYANNKVDESNTNARSFAGQGGGFDAISAFGDVLGGLLASPRNNNRINRPRSNPPRADNRRYRYPQPQQSIERRYENPRSNVNRVYGGYSQPRTTQSNSYSRSPANQVYVSSGFTPSTTYYTKPVSKTYVNSGSNSIFTPSTTYYSKPVAKTYVSSGSSSSSSSKPVYVNSISTTVTKYRASSTESCSKSALSLLPSAYGSGYCSSSCYSILGRESAEKCCQSADSIEAYPVTCYPCKLCTF